MKTNILALISSLSFSDLTKAEKDQIAEYICIYKRHDFNQLWLVNNFITNSNGWDYFPDIRSLNIYNGIEESFPGIKPRYFAIISQILRHVHSPKTYLVESKQY